MSQLKADINRLEKAIVLKKRGLNEDYFQLVSYMKKPSTIGISLIGSFAVGFLLSRKGNKQTLMRKTVAIPFFLNKVYKNFRIFSSLIPF